jgi:gluconolactonase
MKCLLPFLLAPAIVCAADPLPVFAPKVERLDPALDQVLAPGANLEKIAEGYMWSEGPVWKDGALFFSDVPANKLYQWKPGGGPPKIFLQPSGEMEATAAFQMPGSNGLTVDAKGNLILCQQGPRRVARLAADGRQVPIVDIYEGKHFNSPNDVIYASNGDLYFTDPPYGLDGLNDSPLKELKFNGVFLVRPGGKAIAVIKDLTFPNGIALSPDEKTLYIGVSDPNAATIYAYDVQADGTVANRRVFFDATPLVSEQRAGLPDGMKVDKLGNVWTAGPGGILIISPAGKHLGTLLTGQQTGNCAWGDDGSTLYVTANMFICRIKTLTKGAGWK